MRLMGVSLFSEGKGRVGFGGRWFEGWCSGLQALGFLLVGFRDEVSTSHKLCILTRKDRLTLNQ